MEEYLVPTGYGEDEFIEKKSRFIGRVWCVETEEEALEKIHGIGVPLTYCEKTETYHAYLSLQDVHRLGEWGERNGYRIWGSHCDCGDAAEHERAVILPGNFDYPME